MKNKLKKFAKWLFASIAHDFWMWAAVVAFLFSNYVLAFIWTVYAFYVKLADIKTLIQKLLLVQLTELVPSQLAEIKKDK